MCRRALLSLLLAFCAAWATPVCAQDGRYAHHPYGPGVRPLDRILPMVRSGHPGRFYDAEGPFPDANGGYHYRLKWLTPEGRIIWLDADARTGRVTGIARGDWREQGPPPVMPGYERGYGAEPYGPGDMRGEPRDNRFGGPPPFGARGGFGGGWHGHGGGSHGGSRGHGR